MIGIFFLQALIVGLMVILHIVTCCGVWTSIAEDLLVMDYYNFVSIKSRATIVVILFEQENFISTKNFVFVY